MASRRMVQSFSNTDRNLLNLCINTVKKRSFNNIPISNVGNSTLSGLIQDNPRKCKDGDKIVEGGKPPEGNSFCDAIKNEQMFLPDDSNLFQEAKCAKLPVNSKLLNIKIANRGENKEVDFLHKFQQCLLTQKRNYKHPDQQSKYRDDCPPFQKQKPPPKEYVDIKLGGVPRLGRKALPKIPSDCICVEPEPLKDVNPLKRLVGRKIVEPPRECLREPPCEQKVRADDNFKVGPKALPPIPIADCPCLDPTPLRDFAIKRLIKKETKPQPRVCAPPPVCPKAPRADEGLQVKRKKFKEIIPGDCPCIETKMKDIQPLAKLIPKPVKEPERCPKACPDERCCPPRLDEGLKIRAKSLPIMKNSDCPCIDPEPLKDVELKKLTKKPIKQERVCPPEISCETTPRLDDGLTIKRKTFPKIGDADCPCVEIKIKDVEPLKKLEARPVKEPERCKKECPDEKCCPPRLDADFKVRPKSLPFMQNSDCPCIEPEPLKDIELKRLKKNPVPEPKRIICEEKECIVEKQRVEKKKLPPMPTSNCPCVEPEAPSITPALKRLKKCPIPEPEKICPVDPCAEAFRADKDDWIYTIKKDAADNFLKNRGNNDNRRNFSTQSLSTCPELFNILYASGLKRTKKLNSHRGQNNCGNEIRYLNSAIDKLVSLCKFSKEAVILPYINLLHQFSYFGNIARSVSNYFTTTTVQYARSKKSIEDLQPNKPLINEPERIDDPFPDSLIQKLKRERKIGIGAGRKDHKQNKKDDDHKAEFSSLQHQASQVVECPPIEHCCHKARTTKKQIKNLNQKCNKLKKTVKCPKHRPKSSISLLTKIVNYFKARPCPTPEEFKLMYLRKEAEEAAKKAGLCVYDPKEVCKENLPKIINCEQDSNDKCGCGKKTKDC